MKIFFSPASPYVRKCMVTAHELGIAERIEKLPSAASPINRDQTIVPINPLGKVPTLLTDSGAALFDSRVICDYLNAQAKGKLFPEGEQRWLVQTEHALADGILDAALLARYENGLRPEALRWADWTRGQMEKIESGLKYFDQAAPGFGDRVDIGTIALGCVLGYLDFRFADYDWRSRFQNAARWYAGFKLRPSMQATQPNA